MSYDMLAFDLDGTTITNTYQIDAIIKVDTEG